MNPPQSAHTTHLFNFIYRKYGENRWNIILVFKHRTLSNGGNKLVRHQTCCPFEMCMRLKSLKLGISQIAESIPTLSLIINGNDQIRLCPPNNRNRNWDRIRITTFFLLDDVIIDHQFPQTRLSVHRHFQIRIRH